MVGPGACKPSNSKGIESRRSLFLSFSLSHFCFTPILVCEITIIIIIKIIPNTVLHFVSPCVGGSKTPPGALYCIKCLLTGVYLSAKPKNSISKKHYTALKQCLESNTYFSVADWLCSHIDITNPRGDVRL